jgi:hypothetical protein
MKQTIAEQIKWDFKTNGSLVIKDKNGNRIYWENSNGFWTKHEYNSQGNEIYYETSYGFWEKYEYDSQGNKIYSSGAIIDKRPKPCSDKEIVIDGVKYKLTKL